MELRDLLTEIERDSTRLLGEISRIETHSRPEGDLLACLRHAYFNLQALTAIGRRALAAAVKAQEL